MLELQWVRPTQTSPLRVWHMGRLCTAEEHPEAVAIMQRVTGYAGTERVASVVGCQHTWWGMVVDYDRVPPPHTLLFAVYDYQLLLAGGPSLHLGKSTNLSHSAREGRVWRLLCEQLNHLVVPQDFFDLIRSGS